MNIPLAHFIYLFICLYIYIDYHTLIRDLLVFASTRLVRKRVRNIDYVFQRPLCDDGGNEKYWMYKRHNHLYVIKVFLKFITCKYGKICVTTELTNILRPSLATIPTTEIRFLNNFNSFFWNPGIRCVFYNNKI